MTDNDVSTLVIAVLVVVCALPVSVLAWAMLVTVKRLTEHNRDILKSLLALSGTNGLSMAGAMETSDRMEKPQPRPQRVPREVGG